MFLIYSLIDNIFTFGTHLNLFLLASGISLSTLLLWESYRALLEIGLQFGLGKYYHKLGTKLVMILSSICDILTIIALMYINVPFVFILFIVSRACNTTFSTMSFTIYLNTLCKSETRELFLKKQSKYIIAQNIFKVLYLCVAGYIYNKSITLYIPVLFVLCGIKLICACFLPNLKISEVPKQTSFKLRLPDKTRLRNVYLILFITGFTAICGRLLNNYCAALLSAAGVSTLIQSLYSSSLCVLVIVTTFSFTYLYPKLRQHYIHAYTILMILFVIGIPLAYGNALGTMLVFCILISIGQTYNLCIPNILIQYVGESNAPNVLSLCYIIKNSLYIVVAFLCSLIQVGLHGFTIITALTFVPIMLLGLFVYKHYTITDYYSEK